MKRIFYQGYFLLLAALLAVAFSVSSSPADYRLWFHENGIVETIQFTHLFVALLICLICTAQAARRESGEAWAFFLITLGLAWCAHRELDGLWEREAKSAAFAVIRATLSVMVAIVAFGRFQACLEVLQDKLYYRAVILFMAGVAGYIGANMLAHLMIRLQLISRTAKRCLEESLELFASSLFLFGAIELALAWRASQDGRQKPQTP